MFTFNIKPTQKEDLNSVVKSVPGTPVFENPLFVSGSASSADSFPVFWNTIIVTVTFWLMMLFDVDRLNGG